jgi:transcriptional regulator with XRE-family HTH domain
VEGLGARLKRIRNAKQMTLRELGRSAFISHSFIADIESGRCSNPTVDTIEALAKSLGVSMMELLEEPLENVAEVNPTYKGENMELYKRPKG